MRHSLPSFVLNLCFGLLTAQAATAQKYTITDLGTLPGGGQSSGLGISRSGQVTGNVGVDSSTHAFLYSNGTMRDLGTLPGGMNSFGNRINDRERRGREGEETERRERVQVTGSSEVGACQYCCLYHACFPVQRRHHAGLGNAAGRDVQLWTSHQPVRSSGRLWLRESRRDAAAPCLLVQRRQDAGFRYAATSPVKWQDTRE